MHTIDTIGVNRLEMDIQRPSGCFVLGSPRGSGVGGGIPNLLHPITFCHHRVTNIVARIGPRTGPTNHSLLLNAHFDTVPDSPGANDDGAAVATIMDVLGVMAYSSTPLAHDLVFLFNGAEENFLQSAQGFVTKHPWRHSIRAFINLDAAGSGGRELLFRSGPGSSWLMKEYLDAAPHPFCNSVGQDYYESGLVPSATDFLVFKDFGHLPGLDIAYIRNGWRYHTEFDTVERIDEGAIQHAGENLLAVVKAILKSPSMRSGGPEHGDTKWVFLDVIGLFSVYYSIETGGC